MAEYGRAEVVIVADTSLFRRQLQSDLSSAGRDVGRTLDNEISNSLRTTGARIGRQLSRDISRSLSGLVIRVRVLPDLTGFRRDIEDSVRGLRPTVTVDVDVDRSSLNRLTTSLNDSDRSAGGLTRNLTNVTRSLSGVAGAGAGAARGISSLAAAGFAALPALASLVSALAPIAGILAAGPAVIGGYVAGMAALKLATQGFGDAVGAALTSNLADFNEEISKLPPAMQAAAREIRTLQPAFNQLRASVSGAFFSELTGQFQRLGHAIAGGNIGAGLQGIARNFGEAASAVLDFFASADGQSNLASIISATKRATDGLAAAVRPVVKGFTEVGAAVAEAFGGRAASAITNLGQTIGSFLSRIAGSGQAVAWVQGAMTALQQLGGVLTTLGGLVLDVFNALSSGGGGTLNNITAVLETVREVIQPLLPVISELSQLISTVLGGALKAIAAALSPVIEALSGALAPILPKIAKAFEQLFSALTPVAAMIGGALADALNLLLPPLLEIIPQLLDGLVPAFTQVLSALAPLIPIFLQLVTSILVPLLPLLPPIVDLITVLATALAQLLVALSPLIQAAARFEAAILGWVAAEVVVPVLQAVIGVLSLLVRAVASTLSAVARAIPAIIGFFQRMVPAIVGLLSGLPSRISAIFRQAMALALQLVLAGIRAIVTAFSRLWGMISRVLSTLRSNLTNAFRTMLSGAVNAVEAGLNTIVRFFAGLWGRIRGALGNIKDRIIDAIKPDISLNPTDWFANGGVITGPRIIGAGEAGPEVIIPLTRPGRALELMQQTGLTGLARRGDTTINNTFHMQSNASDAGAVAHLMLGQIARASNV